jgi:hypothetical protein
VLPIREAVAELDVCEEVMETVLSYLQVGGVREGGREGAGGCGQADCKGEMGGGML